ncbi:MAG: IS1380 family transposase, partial [Thermoleophilia bacterium]
QSRARAWAAGAAPEEVVLDFDATAITAHSDKELAAGHYKGGFGFHPLLVSCGREVLAAILRPGNAGANNADDHLELFELALEQLPPEALDGPMLARSDSAGASHALAEACRETAVRFSFGYPMDERVRAAILSLPERAWRPAINGDGQPREGAWVAELTDQISLDGWPQGSRVIVRRERPHPGAQLSFTDVDGHRFQCFITDQPDADLAALEARHRAHAIVEDRVRELKSTGLANLPFSAFAANQAWLEAALVAHDLTVWTQLLLFDAEHAACEPKRLRYRLLHVAGRLTRHARQLTLHLPADWPWAGAIARAFKRLAALPA